jgi:predicted acylesterase/phospholipase RssA
MAAPPPITPQQATTADNTGPIALCLSGGGFRATFFHLGVVRLLSETQLLRDVKCVFSVSGGSILTAHMARRWDDYIAGDDKKFDSAAEELMELGRWDLRGRIVRRYLLGERTIKNLEKYYRTKLTDNASLDDLNCTYSLTF